MHSKSELNLWTAYLPCLCSRWYKHSCAMCKGPSISAIAFTNARLLSCIRLASVIRRSNSVLTSFLQNDVSVIRSPNLLPESLCPCDVFSSVSLQNTNFVTYKKYALRSLLNNFCRHINVFYFTQKLTVLQKLLQRHKSF